MQLADDSARTGGTLCGAQDGSWCSVGLRGPQAVQGKASHWMLFTRSAGVHLTRPAPSACAVYPVLSATARVSLSDHQRWSSHSVVPSSRVLSSALVLRARPACAHCCVPIVLSLHIRRGTTFPATFSSGGKSFGSKKESSGAGRGALGVNVAVDHNPSH